MASEPDKSHPAARHSDQLAWAVWLKGDGIDECVAVVADSEAEAKVEATEEYCERNEDVVASRDIDEYHVDGPIQNGEPAMYEFEFVTEHRETVVVEAPSPEYAKESADAARDYRGELIQTTHTESRRIPKEGDDGE